VPPLGPLTPLDSLAVPPVTSPQGQVSLVDHAWFEEVVTRTVADAIWVPVKLSCDGVAVIPDGLLAGGVVGVVDDRVDPVAEPVTVRAIVSPFAAKLTFVAKVPGAVGRNRTVTAWLAPAASDKEPPEVMLYGAPTLTATARLEALVFCTVKLRSTDVPVVTLPKVTAVDGVTPKSTSATPLAALEQALSFPARSTAVTRAKYVVFAVRPTIRWLTVVPAAGARAGEDTE
jgi:hypothetical protein